MTSMLRKGESILEKFRTMNRNLLKPTFLTQSPNYIWFGAKVGIKAPHVQGRISEPEARGVMLSAFITEFQIDYHQDVFDGCGLAGMYEQPVVRNTFIISSPDYCKRDGELLKYNQDFALRLESSGSSNEPLYARYDSEPLPGWSPMYPIYLSKHQVTNTRWRVLPVLDPNKTRFEQEYEPVNVNTDVVINHSKSNQNLCVLNEWQPGFFSSKRAVTVKTVLDVHKRETPINIWHIHSAIPDPPKDNIDDVI